MEEIKDLINELNKNNNDYDKYVSLIGLVDNLMINNEEKNKLIKWLKEESEKDNLMAQLINGSCLFKYNTKEQIEWYKKSAKNGNTIAQYLLGDIYHNHAEYQKAYEWYRVSATGGYIPAYHMLGIYYWKGKGTERDMSKSIIMFDKSRTNGYYNSQFELEGIFNNYMNETIESIKSREKEITELKAGVRKYVVKILDKYIIKDLANIVGKFI